MIPYSLHFLHLEGGGIGGTVLTLTQGPGERLPQLQHLQHRLQGAHAKERRRLDARRVIGMILTKHEETKKGR